MDNSLPLSPPLAVLEGRVLGCLIEKEFSTPDLYPLTLNALVLACNQRSNRDPVLAVAAPEVEAAIAGLRTRRLATLFAGADSRVAKFKHTFDQVFPLDFATEKAAWALLAELLLRGPQTAAALRANAVRLLPTIDTTEVEPLLVTLSERSGGGLVEKLPRQPGQKEARWAQRLAEETRPTGEGTAAPLTVAMALPPEVERRLAALETEMTQLKTELTELRRSLGGA